jgi:hypothetical protein
MALIASRRPEYKEHVHNQVKSKLFILAKEQMDSKKVKLLARYYIHTLRTLPKA